MVEFTDGLMVIERDLRGRFQMKSRWLVAFAVISLFGAIALSNEADAGSAGGKTSLKSQASLNGSSSKKDYLPTLLTIASTVCGNNGHGNDPDHNDSSNPGNSNNGDGTDADGTPGHPLKGGNCGASPN